MADPILIDGAPFCAVSHHDGRFIRAPGLAALARRDADGGYTVLHLQHCEAINREMGPGHARWGRALGQGLNTLLAPPTVASRPRAADPPSPAAPPIRWHADAVFQDRTLATAA
ncbi:hypothetical protein [Phenylobacterium sp.]|uniref:hypothetical protein n=1 Tax=Phenylobacterium sp. TaxID=1871053 RepID=UPI003BAC2D18